MRASSFFLLVLICGCAASAPEIVMSPPAPVEAVTVEREIVSVTPPPVIEELEERTPVPAPSGVIRLRSEFPSSRVTEWTLVNGLTVVYLETPDLEGYQAFLAPAQALLTYTDGDLEDGVRLDASVSQARLVSDRLSAVLEDAERLFAGGSPGGAALDDLLSGRPSQYTLVMTGPVGREWVERDIAVRLSAITGSDPASSSRMAALAWSASVDWDEWPAFLVARSLLQSRVPSAVIGYDASRERAVLEVGVGIDASTVASAFGPASEDDVRRARSEVARRWGSPTGAVDALMTLYGLSGRFRPVRDPIQALEVGERIDRTPPSRVTEILSRFAPSEDE